MPFTISHAAAVVPFSRFLARWRLLSATVIGSMVPDFSLLLPWRLSRIETHSIAGLWSFCLPVGLVTYWLFQWLIKPAVLELLPDAAYQRSRLCAAPADVADLRQWLYAAAGVLAGAVTHLAWDGFTHEGARGVRMFPVLDDSVAGINGHPMMVYRVMQLVSSAVGLLLVMVILWRALRGTAVPPLPQRSLDASQRHQWTALYVLTALAASAVFLWVLLQAFDGHRYTLGSATNEVAIAALRGLALALVGVSGLLRWRLAYSRRDPVT